MTQILGHLGRSPDGAGALLIWPGTHTVRMERSTAADDDVAFHRRHPLEAATVMEARSLFRPRPPTTISGGANLPPALGSHSFIAAW